MGTFTYVGDANRFYATISVDGSALAPVPGESYELEEDPSDGRWEAAKGVVSDKGPVTPDVTKDGSEDSTEAVEGN
jgi:hypothetical protein